MPDPFDLTKTHEANRRTALREPDAGNPHVRFDEGETPAVIGLRASNPVRVSLLY